MGVIQKKDKNKSLERINNVYALLQKVVGQNKCEIHKKKYNLYETPAGEIGGCPICFKEQIKVEDREIGELALKASGDWQAPYIKRFERVSSDLRDVKINEYITKHETQEKAKKEVLDYIKTFDKKKSLILSGAPGLGKSMLAYIVTKALRHYGYKTWFIKTTDLLDLFKSTYRNGSQLTEELIFDLIETVDLLILDDVGSEYIKANETGFESWSTDILYKVMDLRLSKSIVCTTNYTHAELEKKLGNNGPRIISRMLENAKGIRLEGEDHRRKNLF